LDSFIDSDPKDLKSWFSQFWERSSIIWCLGRGICSNHQSAIIWGRGLAKSSYNFYSAEKA